VAPQEGDGLADDLRVSNDPVVSRSASREDLGARPRAGEQERVPKRHARIAAEGVPGPRGPDGAQAARAEARRPPRRLRAEAFERCLRDAFDVRRSERLGSGTRRLYFTTPKG